MTKSSHIYLQVDAVKFQGASDQPPFGDPKDIEDGHPDIRDWVQGLAQDGGAGYA
jgi:hypothetical protein